MIAAGLDARPNWGRWMPTCTPGHYDVTRISVAGLDMEGRHEGAHCSRARRCVAVAIARHWPRCRPARSRPVRAPRRRTPRCSHRSRSRRSRNPTRCSAPTTRCTSPTRCRCSTRAPPSVTLTSIETLDAVEGRRGARHDGRRHVAGHAQHRRRRRGHDLPARRLRLPVLRRAARPVGHRCRSRSCTTSR